MANETWSKVNVTNKLNFNGDGSISSLINLPDEFTIILKGNLDTTTLYQPLYIYDSVTKYFVDIMIQSTGNIIYRIKYNGEYKYIYQNKPSGTYTLAGCYKNGVMSFYIDGILIGTKNINFGGLSTTYKLGVGLTGDIQFAATFNRSFNAEEHKQIYEMLKPPYEYYTFKYNSGDAYNLNYQPPHTWIMPDGTETTDDQITGTTTGDIVLRLDCYNDLLKPGRFGVFGDTKTAIADLPLNTERYDLFGINLTGKISDLAHIAE
jgi:hypothetical protein